MIPASKAARGLNLNIRHFIEADPRHQVESFLPPLSETADKFHQRQRHEVELREILESTKNGEC